MTDRVPLKRVASLRPSSVDKKSREGESTVRLCNYTDVYSNETIRPTMEFMPATATQDQLAHFSLCHGDVILTKDSETADDVGIPAFLDDPPADLVCGYHLTLIRPDQERLDGRYLFWQMSATHVRQTWEATATGVTRVGLRAEAVANLPIRVPALAQQRAIAAFLDTETARIDALIASKQGLVALLDQRWDSLLEAEIRTAVSTHGEAPLRHLTQLGVGIVITPAKWYAADGVPALRGMNVKRGRLDTSDLVFLTDEGHHENFRSRLDAGDIVVVRTGAAGSACVVPPEFDGANCIDVLIVRSSRMFSSKFVELVLNSAWIQRQVELHSVGSIQSHFNVSALKAVRVPAAPVPEQQRIADRLMRASDQNLALRRLLSRQLDLLREHRQALITAAVTGELEVPEVAA